MPTVSQMLALCEKNVVGCPIHTNAFSFENAYFLMRFHLSSTLKHAKTPMKTETFENGFKSGDF